MMSGIRSDRSKGFLIAGIAIAAVAVVMRLFAIDRLPPGLFGDEAVEGLDALDVLAGNLGIWFRAHYGREPIYVYLVALSYLTLGVSALSTRLPAIIAGLLTIPATFLFVREWGRLVFDSRRAARIGLLTTALVAISFWHIQMTRDAHRATLLPLFESLGLFFFMRGRRNSSKFAFAAAGAILGLAIYTYSPGRFVGIALALYLGTDLLAQFILSRRNRSMLLDKAWDGDRGWSLTNLAVAAVTALCVMLPLAAYFAQNPGEFTRRFESVSVLDAESPVQALATSVTGNLAQFVVPGAGYQSKHYNLPGKPVFDLFLAPWLLVGIGLALWCFRRSQYRFLVLWSTVMLIPAFLTADMIPKGVRAVGTMPVLFMFPALAMDTALSQVPRRWMAGLVALSLVASSIWTAYDYFVAWGRMPELPLAFDTDLAEVSEYVQRQPANQPVFVSTQVYRPPTEMLLGRLVPTSRYVDRATRIKEFDGSSSLIIPSDPNTAVVFVGEKRPPEEWLDRLVHDRQVIEEGTYYSAFRLKEFSAPAYPLDLQVSPYLRPVGYSLFENEPSGIALFWRVDQVVEGREDFQTRLSMIGQSGNSIESHSLFPIVPLEWREGDKFITWYSADLQLIQSMMIELSRGKEKWQAAWTLQK